MTESQSTNHNTEYQGPPLRLYNTMSREKEVFTPIDESKPVRMYNCGPTVYDFQHIGNLRAYVFVDVLRRTLEINGFTVKQIINITDVGHLVSDGDVGEDKMTKGLKKEGLPVTLASMKELGEKYAQIFKEDLDKLNIKQPDRFPKASEHVDEDIAFIETLEEKEVVYETEDGLYFDTSKLEDYGKLAGGISSDEDIQQRVENEQKRNPRDFALWKFDDELGWSSPWGQGFPGWHIECSVMSKEYLGDSFDIHTGGIDHIPVHHTNEIAQSETATGQTMAKYWLHNDFMTIKEEKISKSIGNTIYLRTIEKEGFSPLAYRYHLLSARYRTKMNFSWEALTSAENALRRLYEFMRTNEAESGGVDEEYKDEFIAAINDDLNTPKALSVLWDLIGDLSIEDKDKAATLLFFDSVLGLDLANPPEINIPAEVQKLAQERKDARKNENFEKADKLRDKIKNKGYTIKDTDEGFRLLPAKNS